MYRLKATPNNIDAFVGNPLSARITLFYGSPYKHLRHMSWDLLKRLGYLPGFLNNQPWLVLGDFNEVCFSWEVKGGKINGEWQMTAFREV